MLPKIKPIARSHDNYRHSIIQINCLAREIDTFSYFPSNPACTDIMEIYNAVEEMDDDDEVSLADLLYLFDLSCPAVKLLHLSLSSKCMQIIECN